MGTNGKTANATNCDTGTMPNATSECAAVSAGTACDDGDDATMNDVCTESTCAGKVALVSKLTFDIAIDDASDLPDENSTAFRDMETDVKNALAATLTAGALECTADDITILSIAAGSLIIDYKVEVAASAVSEETKASALAAVADPASPLAAVTVTDSSGASLTTGAATAEDFTSYTYKKTSGICPGAPACGGAAPVVADTYVCQESSNGSSLVTVADSVCVTPLGAKPTSQTTCALPPACPTCNDWLQNGDEAGLDCGGSCGTLCFVYVDDVACGGTWSPCTAACETASARVWSESVAQSGTGAGCPSPVNCRPGDDACPPEEQDVIVRTVADESPLMLLAFGLSSSVLCLSVLGLVLWLRRLRKRLKVRPEKVYVAAQETSKDPGESQNMNRRRTAARGRVQLSKSAIEELEEQETKRLQKLFDEFDTDGSGGIDRTELAALTRQLGSPFTEQELDEAMREMDEDGSGDVDFEEFSAWFSDADKSGSKLARMVADTGRDEPRKVIKPKSKKPKKTAAAPRKGGRYIRGIWVPDSIGPFDVTGLWEVTGKNTDDDEDVKETVWLEQTTDGAIVGNDVDTMAAGESEDPYAIKDARWEGYTLTFAQEYPDGAQTMWTAKVTRSAENGRLIMMGGKWSGECSGSFTAQILSGEVNVDPEEVEKERRRKLAEEERAAAALAATPAPAPAPAPAPTAEASAANADVEGYSKKAYQQRLGRRAAASAANDKFLRGFDFGVEGKRAGEDGKPKAEPLTAKTLKKKLTGRARRASLGVEMREGIAKEEDEPEPEKQPEAEKKPEVEKNVKKKLTGRARRASLGVEMREVAAKSAAVRGFEGASSVEKTRKDAGSKESEPGTKGAAAALAAVAKAKPKLTHRARRASLGVEMRAGIAKEGEEKAEKAETRSSSSTRAAPKPRSRRKGSIVASSAAAPTSGPLARMAAEGQRIGAPQPKPRSRRKGSVVASSAEAPTSGPLARLAMEGGAAERRKPQEDDAMAEYYRRQKEQGGGGGQSRSAAQDFMKQMSAQPEGLMAIGE